jgi:HSP20 family molecular chaperone IbpA
MNSSKLQVKALYHGVYPDTATGYEPDGQFIRSEINSGMSAISDSISLPIPNYETKWDEVFIVASRSNALAPSPSWRPSVNAYRCSDQFIIFVELAGMPPETIEVLAETNRVVIRGRRPAPEPACLRSELAQLLALEIDQGTFERALDLPQDVDPREVTTDYRHGLLEIRLALAC